MSRLSDDAHGAPYDGQYAGSAMVFPRRTTSGQQARPTHKQSVRPPEPDHQQGHTFGIHPADEPYDTDSFAAEGADYPEEPVRRRTSAVRYPAVPSRRRETTRLQSKPTKVIGQRRFDRTTLVIWLCLALIVMVGGWWLFSTVASWWQGVQDEWKYGTPRTFQVDQFVGQGIAPIIPITSWSSTCMGRSSWCRSTRSTRSLTTSTASPPPATRKSR